jgi:RPA family protein
MSEQPKTIVKIHHAPLTIAEMKSASEPDKGRFETKNGIKFSGIETIGMVQNDPITKDESTSFVIKATLSQQDPATILVHAKKFSDERSEKMVMKLAGIAKQTLVLVRGKLSIYQKDGQTSTSISPHLIVELDSADDASTRDLWYYKLLKSRIENRYPLLVKDELYALADELGLKQSPDPNDGELSTVTQSVTGSAGTSVMPTSPQRKAASITPAPAPKPAIPQQIKERAETSMPKKPAITGSVADMIKHISTELGMDEHSIAEQIAGLQQEQGGVLTQISATLLLAENLEVDMSKFTLPSKPSPKPVPAQKPSIAKPAKSIKPAEKTPAMKQQQATEDIIRKRVIEILGENAGTINMSVVQEKMKKELNADGKLITEILLKMLQEDKINIDGEVVSSP